MNGEIACDICVIGAGSGGLTVAAGAAQLGASTVLIEKGRMGGDCLNYGCVPSKALLAAGHAAQAAREAHRLGIAAGALGVDAAKVFGHVRATIAAIAPIDSVERFEGLGARVIRGQARFLDAGRVEADGLWIRARRFVIATGSSPFVPPIPGLDEVPYLTNENVFDLDTVPRSLIVLGGGPVGIEIAQAFRNLGARVTVLEMATILAQDDPELVDVVRRRLVREGIEIHEGVRVTRVEPAGKGVAVTAAGDGGEVMLKGSHLLIAAGRRANLAGLDLDRAGIVYDAHGVEVDRRLRTTNRNVFVVGDAVGGYQFTHVAAYHAGIVIRNALFRWPARVDDRAVPWVTYTSPELAQVGMTEARATAARRKVRILRWPFADNDRARTEGDVDGLVKVIATPRGRLLGAGIVGARAGELIHVWALALGQGIGIGAVARMIAPYPTLGEVNKRVAGSFFAPALFGQPTRRLVRFLARFG